MGDAEAAGQPLPAAPNQPAAPAEPIVHPAAPAGADGQLFYIRSVADGRLWQGEILEYLPQARLAIDSIDPEHEVVVETDAHPLVIVMSQDCDLEQDFKNSPVGGTILPNVLFCDLYLAEELRALVRERDGLNSKEWKIIHQNRNQRYQFLHSVDAQEDLKGEGLREMAIDFREYFTVRTEEVYGRLHHGTAKRCRLSTPYVEHVADRFAHYLARVALPRDHDD